MNFLDIFSNDTMIFWAAIVLLATVPTGLAIWHKTKLAAMDADLKMKMLEMGMSADEIERVLAAEGHSDGESKRRPK